jgi:hypothetical protein
MAVHGRNAFKQHLEPGDLLVWIAYMGMNSAYSDYDRRIQEAGLDLVTSYAQAPADYKTDIPALADVHGQPANVLAHVDQPWELPDAEVPLPCPPGKMAPVSGICRTLVFRMLDDEVSGRLARDKQGTAE